MTKDLKIIIIGRVLQIVITLFAMRFMTSLLSAEEVGNYYILLALMAFFNLVLLNPPGMYFSRHLLEWQRNKQLFNALAVFIGWMLIVVVLAAGISLIVYEELEYRSKFELTFFLLYILGSVIVSTTHRNVLFGSNTLGFRKKFVVYLLLTLVTGLIFSSLIVKFYYPYALGWLLGVLLSELLLVYFILKFFIQGNRLDIKKIKAALTKKRIRKILFFTLPIGVTTFLMWGQTIAYRFIVDSYYSAEVLAYIAVGLGVAASVFGSVESIVQQYFNPLFLKKILDASQPKRAQAWNSMAQQVVPIYLFTSFFTFALAEVLINILVDHKFHDSYIYVMIGVIVEFFRVMSNLLNSVAQSEYQTVATVKPYFVGFVISLGLLSSMDFSNNYMMIPLVLGLAYFCVFIYMYLNMKRILDIRYEVDWFKVCFLSLPFGMIFFINVSQYNLWGNLVILAGSGLYYLFAVWLIMKKIGKGVI
jgi:O-antigen/teichoic acid export membrane protein